MDKKLVNIEKDAKNFRNNLRMLDPNDTEDIDYEWLYETWVDLLRMARLLKNDKAYSILEGIQSELMKFSRCY